MAANEDLHKASMDRREVCAFFIKVADVKNRQYGNATKTTGVLGACVEIIGAAARLPTMVLKNPTHGRSVRKKLFDVLMDIHNYSVIAITMMKDDNWEGQP